MKYLALLLLGLLPAVVPGGPGHDHGHEEPPASADPNAPQRRPDGSVFVPKQTQRFIEVRTQPARREALPRSFVLYGQVLAGSDAASRVQALQPGVLTLPRGFLPAVGERVEKGQLLADIELARDAQEGTNQAAEAAELREELRLARMEERRLTGLGELVPQREVDAATARVRSLQARIAVLSQGVAGSTSTIRAPISGIVTGSYASDGQAVQAGELLLELIDPAKLQVEAVTYDPTLPASIATASFALGQRVLNLRYQGRSPQLRQQALPLRFAIEPPADGRETASDLAERLGLVAGLPVQVTVATGERLKGIAVPASALVRNGSNQQVVWVKTAPEHYAPKAVRVSPLDARRVIITAGLEDGERVVVQAANLINQIR